LNFITTACLNCWKVVVKPKTIIQLLDLYEIEKSMGVPCKCGTEHRLTTTTLYGGYFYNRGQEEGQRRYEEVRALVDEHLGEDVPVILKRACTEYEIGSPSGPKPWGPSDKWPELTEEQKELERLVLENFPPTGFNTPQNDIIIANVIQRWIHHAYKHGDMTVRELTGGNPLYKPYVTYHNETKEK
jgi:hypothetical protein